MHKKAKIAMSLFFIFFSSIIFNISYAKYVIEDTQIVAKLDIDRCKPQITLTDITTSNTGYTNYANKTHTISGHIKLTEKNIVRNNLSSNNMKIKVANKIVTPNFKNFSLISENSTEKIYSFSFTNTTSDGNLSILIPENIVEDKSGLINEETTFNTSINIDNTAPVSTFQEIATTNGKANAQITINEAIRPVDNWQLTNNKVLTKEFCNPVKYALPIIDYAQNSAEALIDIKNATNILLQYGTYDAYSNQTLVSAGQISSPKTILDNSICKTEAMYISLTGDIPKPFLKARCYVYTHWGEGAYGICNYAELLYYHGYNPNPSSSVEWFDVEKDNRLRYQGGFFTQLGGLGLNLANKTATNVKVPIPSEIAKQYLYGISGIQFKLTDTTNYSVVYQAYVKDIGWLKASSDGKENVYDHTKPISAFRINIVPKSEKQYLINYWNRDAIFY